MVANIASLFAGIPVKILNGVLYSTFMPTPLAAYFRAYPLAAALGTLVFFVVTLLVEYGIIALWCKTEQIHVGLGKLFCIVLIMNAMTYSVLAPLNYWATRPRCDVRIFTDDASWAQHPLTEIYYIAANGYLCAIMTDGSGNRVLIPDTVRDYQCQPHHGLFLYRNASDALCLFRASDGQITECGNPSYRYFMNEVACSPDGKTVAFWEKEEIEKYKANYHLTFFGTDTKQRHSTEILLPGSYPHNNPILAWGKFPDTLFVKETGYKQPTTITSITVSNNTVALCQPEPQPCEFAEVYGRFSKYWGVSFGSASNECVNIYSLPGLGSHISVRQDGEEWYITDNPGLLKLGNRGFCDVCLLENGQEFVFNDSKGGIYLVNIPERKVGYIASGATFITLTPRYRQNLRGTNDE
jgi:hypothetical protein